MEVMRDLRAAFSERILVLDGAMGTMIQAADLGPGDFGGAELEGCTEHLNLTRPDAIQRIHAAYFDAGADCASTNTFGAAPYVLGEYGLAHKAYEISQAAASSSARWGRRPVRFRSRATSRSRKSWTRTRSRPRGSSRGAPTRCSS